MKRTRSHNKKTLDTILQKVMPTAVFIGVGLSLLGVFAILDSEANPRPADTHCLDLTNTLTAETCDAIETYGRIFRDEFDVDLLIAIIPSLHGRDLLGFTVDQFSKWRVGEETKGKKGFLILIARDEQRAKIEVGYDLEAVFTDQYTGRVERDMLIDFLEQADWERGFLATIENMIERAQALEDGGEDIADIASATPLPDYSQGAGAMQSFDYGAAVNKSKPATPQALRDYFSAQPTAERTFARYFEFCAWDLSDYSLDIFSDLTKEFYAHWPTSSGQRRSEAKDISANPHWMKTDARHGIALFPNPETRKLRRLAPYFLIKTEKGWQMDINTMSRVLHVDIGLNIHIIGRFFPHLKFFIDDYILDEDSILLPRDDTPRGYWGFHYLGSGLYDRRVPGVAINLDDNPAARKTGLQSKDHILSINGKPVKTHSDVTAWLRDTPRAPGDQVPMEVIRGGARKRIIVTAQPLPDAFRLFRESLKTPRVWLGVYMAMTVPYERQKTGSYCAILDVHPQSPAAASGLRPGDLIVSVNGETTPVPRTLFDAIQEAAPGDILRLEVIRNYTEKMMIEIKLNETTNEGYF